MEFLHLAANSEVRVPAKHQALMVIGGDLDKQEDAVEVIRP
jgi:hypothetical protein